MGLERGFLDVDGATRLVLVPIKGNGQYPLTSSSTGNKKSSCLLFKISSTRCDESSKAKQELTLDSSCAVKTSGSNTGAIGGRLTSSLRLLCVSVGRTF